jgi:arsenite methyltransferase
MMTTLQFDDAASRRVEAMYTTADIVEQRRVVRVALGLGQGESVLDIGVGPGLLVAEMAAEVGPTGRVCGVDVSDSMLAIARSRAEVPGGATVELGPADANHLPHPDASFDAVVSTQVFEYVDDVPGALDEVRRVLRPGGRVLLLDTDWDSVVWRSGDDERMARVLAAFESHAAHPHLPRSLKGLLEHAGFEVAPPWILPMFNVGYDPATYSAGLLEIIADFVADSGISADEAAAWVADLRALGPGYFFSLNRYLFSATSRG